MAAANTGRPAGVHVDGIISWGRTFDEYAAFFTLKDVAQYRSILDVGAGPAPFTAEVSAKGVPCTAVDSMYCVRNVPEIRRKFEITRNDVMASFRKNPERFSWSYYSSPRRLEKIRRRALDAFLADSNVKHVSSRYVAAGLLNLPFADGTFDLALGSHILFLYSHVVDLDFHISGLLEMLRVAREVRIYPLVALGGGRSEYFDPTLESLREKNFRLELVGMDFEHLPGATEMPRIRNPK